MPQYTCPLGNPVTADQAMLNGRLRSGYRSVLASGDTIAFDISMCDAAPSATSGVGSVDKAFAAEVAEIAKTEGITPTEWLCKQPVDKINKLMQAVAEKVVAGASTAGIAAAFKMDKARDSRALRDAALRGSSDLAQLTADARATYQIARDAREAQLDWRTRVEPSPPPIAAPVITDDAAADYYAARDAAKARLDHRTR